MAVGGGVVCGDDNDGGVCGDWRWRCARRWRLAVAVLDLAVALRAAMAVAAPCVGGDVARGDGGGALTRTQ